MNINNYNDKIIDDIYEYPSNNQFQNQNNNPAHNNFIINNYVNNKSNSLNNK